MKAEGGNEVDESTGVDAREPAEAGDVRGAPWIARLGDDELLTRVRAGEDDLLGELFRRHHRDARRYAHRLLRRHGDGDAADDVVSEAFRKVLVSLRNGNGPVNGFRPYLFTSVRTMVVNHLHGRRHQHLAERTIDRPINGPDSTVDALVAMDAFRTLPRRWQEVLWATKVLALTPTELSLVVGMQPNAIAALSLRARDALRAAYVRAHLPAADRTAGRDAVAALGAASTAA